MPGPQIKTASTQISANEVNVDPQVGTSAQVSLNYEITDTNTCCSVVSTSLVDPSGKLEATLNASPIFGTPHDSKYQSLFTIPASAQAGLWNIVVSATDFSGLNISEQILKSLQVNSAAPRQPSVSNLNALWSQTTLNIAFDFDLSLPANYLVTQYNVTIGLKDGSSQSFVYTEQIRSQLHHVIPFTAQQNGQLFGFPQSISISSVSILPVFGSGNAGIPATATVPTYASSLPAPIISVIPSTSAYTVSWSTSGVNPGNISIRELVTSATTPPADAVWNTVSNSTTNPVTIFAPDTNARLVQAFFSDELGVPSPGSNIVSVTPIPLIQVNTTPPAPIGAANAFWSTNGVSDNFGNSITVNFAAPANSSRFQVTLTAPNGHQGVFYFNSNGSTNQSLSISQDFIYAQFGAYYSQYTGLVSAMSPQGIASNPTPFVVPLRGNPLAALTP